MNSAPSWAEKLLPSDLDLKQNSMANQATLAIMAYAAGDALGVQYEFIRHKPVIYELSIKAKDGWPFGGVSDDTLLSLITISTLEEENSELAANLFLERLRAAIPALRGLGPTTRAALGLKVSEAELAQVGNSNGAMMRTALCGMAFSPSEAEKRNTWIFNSASATHKNQNAIYCAILLSGIVSELADSNRYTELNIHQMALRVINEMKDVPRDLDSAINNFEKWVPQESGISLDPIETLLAILWVISRADSFEDVYTKACELGGDTDTVAALSAAVFSLASGNLGIFLEMNWLKDISWDEIGNLTQYVQIILKKRGN